MNPPQALPKTEVLDQVDEWIYKACVLRAALELELWAKVAAGLDTADRLAAAAGWSRTGAAYDWGEYKQTLEQAGFTDIEDVAPQPIKAVRPLVCRS